MRKSILGFMILLCVAILADIAFRIFDAEEGPAQEAPPPPDAPAPAPSVEKQDAPSQPPSAPARPASQDAARRSFCLEFPDRAIGAIEAMHANRQPENLWPEAIVTIPLRQFQFILMYLTCQATITEDMSYCDLIPRSFPENTTHGPALRETCQSYAAIFNLGWSYYRKNVTLDRFRVLSADFSPELRDQVNALFPIVKGNQPEKCGEWAKTMAALLKIPSSESSGETSEFSIFLEIACNALSVPADKLDGDAPKTDSPKKTETFWAYQAFAAFRRGAPTYLGKPPGSLTFDLVLAKLLLQGGSCGEELKARYRIRVVNREEELNACLQPEDSPLYRFHWKTETE
ncbi:MAG: hypothetical protein C4523_11905 [Myxococcales bacterium]|nr:MAG: hypothetical protein C4523_11905 [Myxococcales bacterium]